MVRGLKAVRFVLPLFLRNCFFRQLLNVIYSNVMVQGLKTLRFCPDALLIMQLLISAVVEVEFTVTSRCKVSRPFDDVNYSNVTVQGLKTVRFILILLLCNCIF